MGKLFQSDEASFLIQDLPAKAQDKFILEQIANMSASQVVERTYNALGQLTESDWHGEKWRIKYDERGLVDSVDWFDPTAPAAIAWKSVAPFEPAAQAAVRREENLRHCERNH